MPSTKPQGPDTVVVGRIAKPHGLGGDVVVEVLSDAPDRFVPGGQLLVVPESGGPGSPMRIERQRPHGSRLLVGFDGVDDRNAAAALRGAWLEIDRDRVPAPPAGSHYYYELLDCVCRDRGGRELGRVVGVVEDGGGLILALADQGRELLVPFVEAFVVRVDSDEGVIELELPPGLLETCVSTS